MSIDEMKDTWRQITERVERQERLTNEIILQLTNKKSKNNLWRILTFEVFGVMWLFAFIIYMLINLRHFNTPLLLLSCTVSIIISIVAILMSGYFIKKATNIDIVKKSYTQTLLDFAVAKKAYHQNKTFYFPLGIALIIFVSPSIFKLTRNADILSQVPMDVILLYIFGGSILYTILATIHIKFFNQQLREIDELLKEIKSLF